MFSFRPKVAGSVPQLLRRINYVFDAIRAAMGVKTMHVCSGSFARGSRNISTLGISVLDSPDVYLLSNVAYVFGQSRKSGFGCVSCVNC